MTADRKCMECHGTGTVYARGKYWACTYCDSTGRIETAPEAPRAVMECLTCCDCWRRDDIHFAAVHSADVEAEHPRLMYPETITHHKAAGHDVREVTR